LRTRNTANQMATIVSNSRIPDQNGIHLDRSLVLLLLLTGWPSSAQYQQKAIPPQPKSSLILEVKWDPHRFHKADGDTWQMTWAADGNLYAAVGDNQYSPLNFWQIITKDVTKPNKSAVLLVDNMPFDCAVYCKDVTNAQNDPRKTVSIKPAGLLSVGGILYLSVETMNYGDNRAFNRQHNLNGWIVTSSDFGRTWSRNATPMTFFQGRLASAEFLQFGRDYAGARDSYVYAYFTGAENGQSYWDNGDYLLLGRVPKERILGRDAWEFYAGLNSQGQPRWSPDDKLAEPVFSYPRMTSEDHVSYNPGIKRYILANYGFHDQELVPRPNHQLPNYESNCPSQLTLYESLEPWGPWSLFYRDDDAGQCGTYSASFPTKFMSTDGKTMWMVSSGTFDDYNLTLQKLTLGLASEPE